MLDKLGADTAAAFVAGDVEAFEALFKAHQREVYGWIARLVRDPAAAEDLTIETFWRIYRSRARFDPARSFGAWTRRIAVNVAIDHLKRAGRDRHERVEPADPLAAARVEASDTRRPPPRALGAPPPALRPRSIAICGRGCARGSKRRPPRHRLPTGRLSPRLPASGSLFPG